MALAAFERQRRHSRRGAVRRRGPRGGGPRGGRGAALGGLWRGEYQLDDPSLLLLRTVSYQTFDASLPALRAVSCQAAGGDGEPVVEAADSRGVYQRSSSRRAIALLWLPLLGLPYAQYFAACGDRAGAWDWRTNPYSARVFRVVRAFTASGRHTSFLGTSAKAKHETRRHSRLPFARRGVDSWRSFLFVLSHVVQRCVQHGGRRRGCVPSPSFEEGRGAASGGRRARLKMLRSARDARTRNRISAACCTPRLP